MGLRVTVISNDAFRAGDCCGMRPLHARRVWLQQCSGARKAWAQGNNKLRTARFARGDPPSFVVRARVLERLGEAIFDIKRDIMNDAPRAV